MSTKQSYIDIINKNNDAISKMNIDTFIEEENKKNKEKKQKEIDTYSASMDSQIDNTKKNYEKEAYDANASYADEYERNAVQKLINERQIAEVNANLGITNSGRNATQQAAVQLSYANQKGKLDLARRKTLDNLNFALTNAVTTLQNEKASGISKIESYWDSVAAEQGTNAYNKKIEYYNAENNAARNAIYEIEDAEIKAENERIAQQQKYEHELNLAAIEASVANAQTNTVTKNDSTAQVKTNVLNVKNSVLGNMQGELADNNVTKIHNADGSTTYTDKITGISVTYDVGVNPFTGNNNLIENNDTAKAAKKYGTFSNGYQPKGIMNYGKVKSTGRKCMVNNRKQTVWKTDDDTLWVWDGVNNKYIKYAQLYGFDNFDKDAWYQYFSTIGQNEGFDSAKEEYQFLYNNKIIPEKCKGAAMVAISKSVGV